ncbi:hypothetical protein HanXRQr2_Chr04g0168401 [Helianthus annuus]|uniref:Uncharacterized protein n=1 Tax=Helianthus annuus TaxID=4232 RepID=A0A9K3J7P9_HELAN|nr:hypothetical protein HanXRQr2_Chr04g0168401 [Helianthus annuus]KAJ0931464.1 hypothetical protein HanPSC8_Chr04g0161941 [Helianthus annuus]
MFSKIMLMLVGYIHVVTGCLLLFFYNMIGVTKSAKDTFSKLIMIMLIKTII